MFTLALDCGSTNLKAALFDERLQRVAACARPLVYTQFAAGRAEFDADAAWQETVDVMCETLRQAGVAPQCVQRVALTSQAQTFTLLDGAGQAITPFISWMDVRAAAQAEWLREQLGDEFHHHCSFASPIAELQAAKMLWLKQYAPDLLQRAALVTSLPAWLTLRLGGVSAIDRNLAAMSGLYSLSRRGWWDEMLELCGLEARQLPALVDVGVPVRAVRTCADIALASDIEFIFAGNDHTAGALANGCSAGEMIVTLGTALVAYRHAGDRPGPYAQQGCWGPYPGGGYYELAVLTQGCAALDWARHELLPGEDVAAFFACAGTAGRAGAESEVFFYPERMERADAWTGAGECPQRALAVLEGIGFALRRLIADGLHADPGLRSVTALGGGSRSDVWLQIIADILACSVRRGRGDSLQGAAMMANPHTPQRQPQAGEMFTPTAHGSAHYRRLYERWKAG